MRTTFLVGRLTPGSAEMVVVDEATTRSPFPGPWQLRAVVRRSEPSLPRQEPRPTVQ